MLDIKHAIARISEYGFGDTLPLNNRIATAISHDSDSRFKSTTGLGWNKEGRLVVNFKLAEPEWTTEQKEKVAAIFGHDLVPAKSAVQPEK